MNKKPVISCVEHIGFFTLMTLFNRFSGWLKNIRFVAFSLYLLSSSLPAWSQLGTPFTAVGRGGAATTFATDYHAIGVNAANLGVKKSFRDPRITVGFFEPNIRFFSSSLNVNEQLAANQPLLRPNKSVSQFSTPEEKRNAVEKYANEVHGFDAEVTLFGLAINLGRFGGIGFKMSDRISQAVSLNPLTTSILFEGHNSSYFKFVQLNNGSILPNEDLTDDQRSKVRTGFTPESEASNYGEIMDGSSLQMIWFRTYNLSYGCQLIDTYNFDLHVGAGIRTIDGMMLASLSAENKTLSEAIFAFSPSFGLALGNDSSVVKSPNFAGFQDNLTLGGLYTSPQPVGSGRGYDIGINMVIKKNLFIGIALNEIGQIIWNANTFRITNGTLAQVTGPGYNTYNLMAFNPSFLGFGGTRTPFGLTGSAEFSLDLPTTLRMGVSYEFFKTAHIGLDVCLPQNDAPGSLNKPLYALGGDLKPNRILRLSAGVSSGGNQGALINFPVGIFYESFKKTLELGVATSDLGILASPLTNTGATISLSFGARLKF
ncbi:MAG: hypothetical protein EAZ67_04220 [Cytophagales bacterium]|nr:MAG: hypothetical protein EAZ67_04220 [Cytophagales bacterium]